MYGLEAESKQWKVEVVYFSAVHLLQCLLLEVAKSPTQTWMCILLFRVFGR